MTAEETRSKIRNESTVSGHHRESFMNTVKVLNSLPNIENKKYLELGIDAGWTFDYILCKDKTGVDIKHSVEPDYAMKTDDYFYDMAHRFEPPDYFDLIYIDADHSVEAVMKDFNNATQYLNPNGLIFIHDLFPRTKDEIGACGDGFRWLCQVRECLKKAKIPNFQIITCKDNHGLTLVTGARYTSFYWTEEQFESISYQIFMRQQAQYKALTQQEMCLQAQNIRDIVPEW